MRMKKCLALLLTMSLLASLAACGQTGQTDNSFGAVTETAGENATADEEAGSPAETNAEASVIKQTADRSYQVNEKNVLVSVDLSGGWSVSFASGAVYLYENAEKEAVAFGYPLNEEEYNEHAADCRSYEDFTETDGEIKASDGEDEYSSSWHLFPVGGDAYFMVVADNMVDGAKADVEGIFARFDVKLEGGDLSKEDPLSLWTPDAPLKKTLTAFVKNAVQDGGAGFIPEERRIAVFDLDGTLFCETDPNYFDYTLLVHRVLEDPDYKDKASEFERETAFKIVEQNQTGASFEGLEVDHGQSVASAFSGMTVEAFNDYIQEFKKLPMPSYEGMTRGDGWYLPMLQVVEYLQSNGFTVYVVSGTDRFIVRGIAYDSPLRIPPRQIIGSDESLVASNQAGTDGLNYVFDDDDQLVLGGQFLMKNLKMNKVTVIAQEIGVQPVLSFGNSTGDSSMAEYVTSGNPYPSLAFMLCCDDTVRENGNAEKADKMYSLCEEFDWIPVSMKNDWTTIYGESVTKK